MTLAASMAIAVGVPVSNAAPVSPATKQTQRSGPAKAPAVPKLKGNVLYSSNWTLESQPSGIYYVPTQESETFEMIVPTNKASIQGHSATSSKADITSRPNASRTTGHT